MKKSNKITAVYVIASILLFVSLLAGGIYGIYLSVGINFMRSTVSNVTDAAGGGVSNVSYGASANFQPSMIGVIILSAILILLAIFDFVCLIRQIVFFKQFKLIRESKLEHAIEKKIKSKSSVIFFTFLINVLSFLIGIVGIFVNLNTFVDGGMSWVLYVVDGLVSIFAVISIVMLIQKLRINKKLKEEQKEKCHSENQVTCKDYNFKISEHKHFDIENKNSRKIDEVEYVLLKLKNMKEGKIISEEEYNQLREKMTGIRPIKNKKRTKESNVTKTAK